MVKLRNFLLRKVYNIFKDHCYKMFRLQSVQGKRGYEIFIQNCQVTKCFGYKMLGYEIGVTSCGYEMSKLRHVWQPIFLGTYY